MLGNHELPYVGRFACDWPRLATTDPHAARATRLPRAGARARGAIPGLPWPGLPGHSARASGPPDPPVAAGTSVKGPTDQLAHGVHLDQEAVMADDRVHDVDGRPAGQQAG